MKNSLNLRHLFVAAIFALGAIANTASADEGVYFQWYDQAGKLNVSDHRPAVGIQYDTIKKKARRGSAASSSVADVYRAINKAEADKQRAMAEKNENAVDAANEKARRGNCDNASEELRIIGSNARVREIDAQGEYHYLTDDQKQARAERAQENIDRYCDAEE